MRHPRLLLTVALTCALAACSYKPTFINEYKIDIQQGNVLTQDMVAQLKPGQTRDQVRFLLGTPLITDIFHQWRWDYLYRYHSGKTGEVETRRLTLVFGKDDRLERVEGDVTAAAREDLLLPASRSRLVELGTLSAEAADKPLAPREEPGYFRRLLNLIGL